jgi:hypothetical protein
MIGVNGAFIRSLNFQDVQQNRIKVLYVFDNNSPPPTPEEVKALIDADSNGNLVAGDLINFATARGDTLLQANFYDNLSPEYPGPKLVRWPLAERSEEFIHQQDGNIGWFFFASCSTTQGRSTVSTSPETLNTILHFTYIGDAGDENSAADLGLLSGSVELAREYSTTDLDFAYV